MVAYHELYAQNSPTSNACKIKRMLNFDEEQLKFWNLEFL